MDSRPLQHGPVISGFSGENTVLSELVLPPTVSPDARNIDYKDQTIRKRKGWVRVNANLVRAGSMYCNNTTGMTHTRIGAYDFASTWYIEFLMNVLAWPSADTVVLNAVNGATGFNLTMTSAGKLKGTIYNGVGAPLTTGTTTGVLNIGETCAVRIFYDPSITNQEFQVELTNSTNTYFSSITCVGHTISTLTPWVWAAANSGRWLIDDIRIWNQSSGANIITVSTSGLTPPITGLVGYYTFDAAATPGFDSTANVNTGTVTARGLDLLKAYSYSSYTPQITGIHPIATSGSFTKVLLSNPQTVALYDAATDFLSFIYSKPASSNARWTDDALNGITVLVNGVADNYRYDTTNGLAVLSPSDWSNSGVSIGTTAGATPDGGAGTYSYLLRWRNSATGDEGASAAALTQASGAASVQITGIPTSTELGVDKVRIYRTTVGGSAYYFLKDITNGTATYTDNGADTLSSTLYDERYGKAPSAVCVANFNNMILLGSGSTVYASEIGSTGRHYAFNTITLGNGDGGTITACLAVSGVCVFFKTNGIYAVNGYSPLGLSTQKLFAGQGAMHASAVCASDEAVYYLTRTGICRLPLPVGSAAPVEITSQSHRSLFDSLTDTNRNQCTLAFDLRNRVLYATFLSGSTPVTLVFDEKRGFFSRHDMDADVFRYFPLNGGVPNMYMGWQGYLAKLDTGNNAGVDVGASSYAVTGNPTSAASTLIDSGAAFPTAGSGLSGLTLTIKKASDGSYNDYIISKNTATTINVVGGAISPATTTADTYYIGRINGYWVGPQMLIDGKGDGKTALHRLNVWQRAQAVAKTLTTTVQFDADGTTSSESLSTDTVLTTAMPPNSGHRLSVKFQNQNPNEPFEVEGFQPVVREGSTR